MHFFLWLLDRRTARIERKIDVLLGLALKEEVSGGALREVRESLSVARRRLAHTVAEVPPTLE